MSHSFINSLIQRRQRFLAQKMASQAEQQPGLQVRCRLRLFRYTHLLCVHHVLNHLRNTAPGSGVILCQFVFNAHILNNIEKCLTDRLRRRLLHHVKIGMPNMRRFMSQITPSYLLIVWVVWVCCWDHNPLTIGKRILSLNKHLHTKLFAISGGNDWQCVF
ncbi:Uncharacterised protein [Vibrio cholerae]|nr:Uncharacterised protein [Vibrio cholerae]